MPFGFDLLSMRKRHFLRCILKLFSVFPRGPVHIFPEEIIEIAHTLKSTLKCNGGNGFVRILDQSYRAFQAADIYEIIE